MEKSNTCRRKGLFFFCTVEVHRTDTGLPRVAGWTGPIQCTLGTISQRDQSTPCDHGMHATGSAAYQVWSQQGPGARNVPASAPVYGSAGKTEHSSYFTSCLVGDDVRKVGETRGRLNWAESWLFSKPMHGSIDPDLAKVRPQPWVPWGQVKLSNPPSSYFVLDA